jgi:hypothetical protein
VRLFPIFFSSLRCGSRQCWYNSNFQRNLEPVPLTCLQSDSLLSVNHPSPPTSISHPSSNIEYRCEKVLRAQFFTRIQGPSISNPPSGIDCGLRGNDLQGLPVSCFDPFSGLSSRNPSAMNKRMPVLAPDSILISDENSLSRKSSDIEGDVQLISSKLIHSSIILIGQNNFSSHMVAPY